MASDSVGATQQEQQIHQEGTQYVKDQALGRGGQSESYGQANPDELSSSGQQPGRDTGSYTIGESLGDSATSQQNTEARPEENRNIESSGRGETFDESNEATVDEEGATEHKKPQMGDPNHRKGGLENKDAIPTAGGEKLGEKHWGESKIVPDNPKPQDSGVASKEGQPDSTTSDNTAKNTGGATGGPHSHGHNQGGESGEGKEKFIDKVKDKLHIGKKE